MIERIDDLDGIIGMRVTGTFDVDDLVESILPEVARIDDGSELRLLLHLGPAFDGFGEGAWGELTDELRRIRFHRGAVVTDDVGIRTGLALLRWTLHGQVRSFADEDFDRAVRWVGE